MTDLYFVGCPAPCTDFLLLPLLLLSLGRSFVFSQLLGHPGRKEKEVGPKGVVEGWGGLKETGKSYILVRRMGEGDNGNGSMKG